MDGTTATTTATTQFDSSSSSSSSSSPSSSRSTIHLIVLVHGWMGRPNELGTLEEALRLSLNKENLERSETSESGEAITATIPVTATKVPATTTTVVHAATCNDGRTWDGIAAGGTRLAVEINQSIRRHLKRHLLLQHRQQKSSSSTSSRPRIVLSLVGNSLGGLYARYALKDILWETTVDDDDDYLDKDDDDDGGDNGTEQRRVVATVTPGQFITTCTPHLGVSRHTFLPLPRIVERGIAVAMGKTGQDLFRINDLLDNMTRHESFLRPLSNFQRRVAYANVYGTDFQVPPATAAFWEIHSKSIHRRPVAGVVGVNDDIADDDEKIPSEIVMILETDQQREKREVMSSSSSSSSSLLSMSTQSTLSWSLTLSDDDDDDDEEDEDEDEDGGSVDGVDDSDSSAQQCVDHHNNDKSFNNDPASTSPIPPLPLLLSEELDRLGWTKVLCDVRQHLPGVGRMWSTFSSSSSSSSSTTTTTSSSSSYTTQELLERFDTYQFQSLPLGHTVAVANAKDRLNRWLTQGGRPVMDYLARDILKVHHRLEGQQEEDEEEEEEKIAEEAAGTDKS